jgi:hypothetical protein
MEETACFLVLQLFLRDDVIKQLSTRYILHYQEQLSSSFDNLIQLNDVRMSDNLQDLDFTHHPLDVCLIFDFIFL